MLPQPMPALLVLLVSLALLVASTATAQTVHKCTTASGAVEYRNTPCEAARSSAVKGGTVNQMPAIPATYAVKSDDAGAAFSLDKLGNPIKALRGDPSDAIDMVAVGECRSTGGHYVQGAGCLAEPPRNRNPAIGEAKMKEICSKLGKKYVKALNDCV